MLAPVSLRICWIAAMAPALTEAATQADNFNLPHSPATSNINFGSATLNKFGDISLQTLTEIVGGKHKPKLGLSPGSEDFLNDPQVQKCRSPWKALGLHAENYANINHHGGLLPPVNGHDWTTDRVALKSKRLVEVTIDRRKNSASDPAGRTMNKDNQFIQDNMGLLKANTSLECENKSRNLGPHIPQVIQKPSGCPVQNKKLTVNDKSCNSALRRLTVNENFKNFQWSKMLESVDKEESGSNIFSQNSALKARARQVLRRVRKLQLRQVECHTKNQLKSFVEHEQSSLGISCQRQLENHLLRARNTEELKAELLQSEDVKLLSTAALVNLVRKLEHGTSFTHSRNLCESLLNKDKRKVIARVNPAECQEIKRTSGMLLGNIRHLESAADSDATESSSGGESTDELTDSEELSKAGVLRSTREATMSWAVDRASAASQWTWLQAQVSDLEYKIRQQNDLYRQVRSSKGAVVLEGSRKDSSRTDERMSPEQRLGSAREESKTVNGFLDGVSNGFSAVQVRRLMSETSDQQKHSSSDVDTGSSRTRPLRKVFRKRKLLRTAGLHTAGRKMSRLSSVKCGCNSLRELLPCVLCGGRYNNTQTLDPDVMPMPERIALLDSSYHLVLSFKQDTPLSLHFEKLLRREEYCKPVKSAIAVKKKARIPIQPLSLSDQARKHSRKLAKNAAQTLLTSAKLRKKMGTRRTNRSRFLLKREETSYRKKFSTLAAYRRRRARRRSGSMSSESSKPGSPVPSPLSSGPDTGIGGYGQPGKVSSLQDILRRRRLESAYDINNIVIPYSIAATTRVEKLQYKEILTPKWRLIEPDELLPPENEPLPDDDEEPEDMSDDYFATRHLKCELEEKKRFLGYKQMMHGRSRLRSIRGDSRADSSGANTPDPMSPHHQSDAYSHDSWTGGWNSPVASPPPVVVQMEEQGAALPFIRPERRRTISKRLSEDDRSSLHEETPAHQPPYEHRTFPLADEEYEEMRRLSAHLEHQQRPESPCGSTSSGCSVPEEDDDPADPEWTVVMEDGGSSSSSQKPSLVLKLAKR